TQAQNQVRVFFDANKNAVYVQASTADMKDIEAIIRTLDSGTSGSINELRIFQLRNAYSDEVASLLYYALTSNAVAPSASANAAGSPGGTGNVPASPFATGGNQLGGNQLGGNQLGGNLLGGRNAQLGGANTTGAGASVVGLTTAGSPSKTTSVRFFAKDGKTVDSGYLVDIHILSDSRTNSILVSPPP